MEICNADVAKFAPWQVNMAKRALGLLQAHEGIIPEEGMIFPDLFN